MKYTTAFQNVRYSVLKRDNYRCVDCGVIENLDVHHIIKVRDGGSDDPSNLVTVCRKCHRARDLAGYVHMTGTKLIVDIPDDLHKKLKMKVVQDGTTMRELVQSCLEKMVK